MDVNWIETIVSFIVTLFNFVIENPFVTVGLIIALSANVIFLHSLLIKVDRKTMNFYSLLFLAGVYTAIYSNNISYTAVYNYIIGIMSVASIISIIELLSYKTSGQSDYLYSEALFAQILLILIGALNFNFFGLLNHPELQPLMNQSTVAKILTILVYLLIYWYFRDKTVTKNMHKP
jgi:hypothetical protein